MPIAQNQLHGHIVQMQLGQIEAQDYNYFNGTSWGSSPTVELETERTGWPNPLRTGSGKEIIISHSTREQYIPPGFNVTLLGRELGHKETYQVKVVRFGGVPLLEAPTTTQIHMVWHDATRCEQWIAIY